MDYIIRKCEEKDISALVQLCRKHSYYEQATYTTEGKQIALEKAIFSDPPKLFCYIIELNGKQGGYFTYTFDFSTWDARTFIYLDCLYLESELRGHTIGERVIDKLKEIAKVNDCVNIQWQTPIFNERAIKFYNRVGGRGKEKVRFFIEIA